MIVLVDPILPPEDPGGFWRALDRDVHAVAASVHVLLTTALHMRDSVEMLGRYPGSRLWAHRDARAEVEALGLRVSDPFDTGSSLPTGFVALDSGRPGECMLWNEGYRTLVVGNVLTAGEGGRLESTARDEPAVGAALRSLESLGVECILASHGPAVVRNAAEALSRCL